MIHKKHAKTKKTQGARAGVQKNRDHVSTLDSGFHRNDGILHLNESLILQKNVGLVNSTWHHRYSVPWRVREFPAYSSDRL